MLSAFVFYFSYENFYQLMNIQFMFIIKNKELKFERHFSSILPDQISVKIKINYSNIIAS